MFVYKKKLLFQIEEKVGLFCSSGGGGNGYPEKDSQSPGHQVEASLI